MSRRTPARLPTFHASNVPSHHTSFGTQRHGICEATLEAALEQIVHSFVNIDFNRFFKTFHPHSFVYRYIEKFDCDQFTESMLRAFPAPLKSRVTYSEVQAAKDAKIELNEQLHLLICVFTQIQEVARLNVGNTMATLVWVGRRNYETYIALLKEPVPHRHPLDSNPLPPPPRHVHWVSQQYLEPSLTTAPSPTYHFEELSPTPVAVPQWIFHPHDQEARGHSEPQSTVMHPMRVHNANVASEWDPKSGPSRLARNTVGGKERHVDMTPGGSSSHIDTNGSRSSARSRPSHDSDKWHPPMYRHRSASASASYGRTGRSPDRSHARRAQEEEDDVSGYIPPPPYDLIFPPGPAKSRARNIIENIKTLKSYFKSR